MDYSGVTIVGVPAAGHAGFGHLYMLYRTRG